MLGKFTQSEAGNITVMSSGINLMIWIDDKCYMITDPSTDNPFYQNKVHELEFDPRITPDELKAKIDQSLRPNK